MLFANALWASGIPIIIDTDMMTDCDDAGALAMAHALTDNGELNLIGVALSTRDTNNKNGNVVSAINYYYNRPNIPISMARRADMTEIRVGTSPYSVEIYNNFSSDHLLNDARPDAVETYRQLLSDADDGSVVIAVIGHFYNIEDLLKSPGDEIDSRSGLELVTDKVKELILTGGWLENPGYPADTNLGSRNDGGAGGLASEYVFNVWPHEAAKIIISGADLGISIITGPVYQGTDTPMETAYIHAYNGIDGRPSWDQTAILLAARGTAFGGDTYWLTEDTGYANVNYKGQLRWESSPDKNHEYLLRQSAMSDADLAVVLSDLMGQPPGTGFGANNLVLSVDTTTGNAQIVNLSPTTSVDLQGYTITSLNGSLLASFESDLSNAEWQEVAGSENGIGELNPSGSTTLAPAESFNLTGMFSPGEAEDLEFQFRRGLPEGADFNGDGLVDGDDLTGSPLSWDQRFGADLTGNDFLAWQRLFGTVAGSFDETVVGIVRYDGSFPATAAAATVPEPTAVMLGLLGLGWFVAARRR